MTPEALNLIKDIIDAQQLEGHVAQVHNNLIRLGKFLDYAEKQFKDIAEGRKAFVKEEFLKFRKMEIDTVTNAYNDLEILMSLVLNTSVISTLVHERNMYKQLFEDGKYLHYHAHLAKTIKIQRRPLVKPDFTFNVLKTFFVEV